MLKSGRPARGSRRRSRGIFNLPFYRALLFTLVYTFVVTPLAILLGFILALAVNLVPGFIKGPVIFFSLLPMIVTPLVGSLILFWMIDAQGIIGATLQRVFNNPDLSLNASATLSWVTLFVYGVWTHAPVLLRRVLRRPADRAQGHAGNRP